MLNKRGLLFKLNILFDYLLVFRIVMLKYNVVVGVACTHLCSSDPRSGCDSDDWFMTYILFIH